MRAITRVALMLVCVQAVAGCGGGGSLDDSPPAAETALGIYGGIASTGESLTAFVLGDGRFWIAYQSQSAGGSLGFVYGEGNEEDATFASISATEFRFEPPAITPSALTATVQASSSLTGTLRVNGQDATFNLLYGEPPLVSNIDGTYQTVISELTDGAETLSLLGSLTVGSSGAVSGTAGDCSVSGSAKPRGDVNVHDLSLTLTGSACPMSVSLDGIAYFEELGVPRPSTRQMTGFVTSAAADTGFLFSAVSF